MTATMTLYQIADAREILVAWLEESEGEMTPELEALLADLDGQEDEKIERVALFVRERLAHASAVKLERDRLDATVKREEKAAESLKAYLKRQMERLNKGKVVGVLATVAIQKNSQPSVTCALTDVELQAAFSGDDAVGQFVREVPVSYRVDRDAVLMAYKAGDVIPPSIVVDHGSHIRIR